MIQRALKHLPGIGPRRTDLLQAQGLDSWEAIIQNHYDALRMGVDAWRRLQSEACRCEQAVQSEDVAYLARALHPSDHWRLLAHWFDRLTFFDIETTGCDWECETTVIAFYTPEGQVHRFVRDENLAEALDTMQQATLLVSFNGNTFDVPRVLETFHIPELPAPHVDLRWVCYHYGYTGGLKHIEHEMGLIRPNDLEGVDGLEAVRLWQQWTFFADQSARERLLRYCSADVVGLYWVTARLLQMIGCPVTCPSFEQLWETLGTHGAAERGGPSTPEASLDATSCAEQRLNGGLPGTDARLENRLRRQWKRWREAR